MHFLISIDLYQQDLLVAFGSTQDLAHALSPYVGEQQAWGQALSISQKSLGRTVIDEAQGVYFLWMPQAPTSPETWGVLAHEVAHAAWGILQKIGISPCPESEEAYAYLIQFLTERIYERCQALTSSCRAPQP